MDGIYLNETVSAGLTSKPVIRLDSDNLMLAGINDIVDITLDFQIEDKDYNTVALTGPLVIKTNLAGSWDYEKDTYAAWLQKGRAPGGLPIKLEQFKEEELFSQNDVHISSAALFSNGDEKALRLEVENTSDTDICLSVNDIAINELTIAGGGWTRSYINKGHRGFIDLTF